MRRQLKDNVLQRILAIKNDYADTLEATSQELRLYHWFHTYLCQEILNIGGVETGYVFRQSDRGTLLVYKATFEDVRRVVFVSASTPVECMRIFCRQYYDDQLKWVKDKYQ